MGRVDSLYLRSEIHSVLRSDLGRRQLFRMDLYAPACGSRARAYKLACQRLWLNLTEEGAQELDVCVWRTQDHQAPPVGFLPRSGPPNLK